MNFSLFHIIRPSRYKSQVMRSSTYTQALASDAINELHPDQLARFMKVKNLFYSINVVQNIEPANFKLSEHEKPITPVAALKMKFEKKAVGDQHHYVSFARQELLVLMILFTISLFFRNTVNQLNAAAQHLLQLFVTSLTVKHEKILSDISLTRREISLGNDPLPWNLPLPLTRPKGVIQMN